MTNPGQHPQTPSPSPSTMPASTPVDPAVPQPQLATYDHALRAAPAW
ncbi:hypothetical protein [Plantibacter sp. CFBP 8775]|nr:hypothetical protein [Plantibacter sp. CFBP 8775]MBD8102185.1 hypothetical protein [Plantibacter sp. CFBP 8775]